MLPVASEHRLLITEGFLSSAPKTSKRTRRPRPKPKTTPTTKAPQTRPGKCGFLVKRVSLSSSWESGSDADGRSDAHVADVCEGAKWSAAAATVELAREDVAGDTWVAAEFLMLSA